MNKMKQWPLSGAINMFLSSSLKMNQSQEGYQWELINAKKI